MPLNPNLPAAVLETILTAITTLLVAGAGGDATVARQSAMELLGDYHPQNAAELSLAATIISCNFRSLDLLEQATAKTLPTPTMLRLHSSAVSLSREAVKAQRQLAQLRKERRQAQPAQSQPDPVPAPAPTPPPAPTPAAQETPARPLGPIAQFAKDRGISRGQAYRERERERRIAASIKRAHAKAAAANATRESAPTAPPASPALA